MKGGYQAWSSLMKVLLLPTPKRTSDASKWVSSTRTLIKSGKLTPRQSAKLRALVSEYKRRVRSKSKVKMYPAGARSNSGKPASKGRRVSMMPFGTWYYVS